MCFLQSVSHGHGERTDRNRTGDEKESFVHHNPKSERYPNQQCNPCRIHCLFFVLSHDASFHFLLQENGSAPPRTLCMNCVSLSKSCPVCELRSPCYLGLPSFATEETIP